jgi:hypothetical protein
MTHVQRGFCRFYGLISETLDFFFKIFIHNLYCGI